MTTHFHSSNKSRQWPKSLLFFHTLRQTKINEDRFSEGRTQHYVLSFYVKVSYVQVMKDSQVFIKHFQVAFAFINWETALHSKLNAFWVHQNIKTKIGLDFRPYLKFRSYFHKKPLFDSFAPWVGRSNRNTFHSYFFPFELSFINICIISTSSLNPMPTTSFSKIEDETVDWEIAPLNVDNNSFFVDCGLSCLHF